MYRLLNIKILIVVGCVIGSVFLFSLTMSSFSPDKMVLASVSDVLVEPNELVSFSDSTAGADSWLWEFGNGDQSTERSGGYRFVEPGTYQIRLTINDELEKRFIIEVRNNPHSSEKKMLIEISAPEKVIQNEKVVFKGIGLAEKWRWEFGESGVIDSRDKQAIYSYSQPGIYSVKLSTETTKYPILHIIEVTPHYQENDTTDVLSQIGQDIKRNLQAIVAGRSFNKHYNYILSTFLCKKPNTLVVINNNTYNDFYSYCQGLRIIGKSNKTIIENVLLDLDPENESCIKQLNVIQYDSKGKK